MIQLYTDHSLLIPENRRHAHPLIFDLFYYEHTPQKVFLKYELVNEIEKADAVIFPINFLAQNVTDLNSSFKKLLALAHRFEKKYFVYTGGDYGKTFKDPCIIVWRNAGFKNITPSKNLILPAFMNDPLENDFLKFELLHHKKSPQISFTGFATKNLEEVFRITLSTLKNNFKRLLGKDLSDSQKFYNAARTRYRYLKLLERSNQVVTQFIYRNKYRAGAVTKIQRKNTTLEFFQNLNNSPYTFCLRGAGNFSVRFYESLALGRIPVLIDTDVVLPLEEIINWDEHICRVKPDEDLIDKINKFHNGFDQDSFLKLQTSNRELYESYLNRHMYLCQVHDVLKTML